MYYIQEDYLLSSVDRNIKMLIAVHKLPLVNSKRLVLYVTDMLSSVDNTDNTYYRYSVDSHIGILSAICTCYVQ